MRVGAHETVGAASGGIHHVADPLRRALGLAASLAGVGVVLAGCGFQLKRAPELRFRTIQLSGFNARSPLAAELKAAIDAGPTTRVVESADAAEVVLEALEDEREKSVVASIPAALVREFQLRTRLRFRLRTPGGRELIPETEILLKRDMSYLESAALAKEREEELLYRAMQRDIVGQLLRRLAMAPAP
jgi:LPS-assembly lipoprotein